MRVLSEVIDALGREGADRLGQQVGEVGDLDALGNLVLRLLRGVQHRLLPLDERPLEGLLGTEDVDTLAILARDIEQRAIDASGDIAAAELDVTALDRKR